MNAETLPKHAQASEETKMAIEARVMSRLIIFPSLSLDPYLI